MDDDFIIVVIHDEPLGDERRQLILADARSRAEGRRIVVRTGGTVRTEGMFSLSLSENLAFQFVPIWAGEFAYPNEDEFPQIIKPWRENRFARYSEATERYFINLIGLVGGFRDFRQADAVYASYRTSQSRKKCYARATALKVGCALIDL